MPVIHDKSKNRVYEAMKCGSWMTIPQIGTLAGIQDNTCVKNLKFLRDGGQTIEKRRVDVDTGKHYYEYRMLVRQQTTPLSIAKSIELNHKPVALMNDHEYDEHCMEIVARYPVGHVDRVKTEMALERRRCRVAA